MKLKKIIALALAACFSMSMTAFAADSPENEVKVTGVTVNGQEVSTDKISVSLLTKDSVASEYSEISYLFNEDENLGEEISPELDGMALLSLVDVNLEGVEAGSPVTVTFQVTGVTAGDNVKVIHYHNGSWEVIQPDQVSNNTVTVTLTSFSPVGFVIEKSALANASTASTTTTAASPATGGINTTVVAGVMVGCIVLAGAMFALKRKAR